MKSLIILQSLIAHILELESSKKRIEKELLAER